MKKWVWVLFMMFGMAARGFAQTQEAKQLLLDVEKLAQLKGILTDMKKGYEILSGGYNTIRDISKGDFNLHDLFLNSLLEVSPAVKKYQKIDDVINAQVAMVSECRSALTQLRQSGELTPREISYIQGVQSALLRRSLQNLDDLATIITAGKLRMSDDERLSAIDDIWKRVSEELAFLRHFDNHTKLLALQRAREHNDVSTLHQLFNLTP